MSNRTWKVYGHDTFAREDYFVGEFQTEAEANTCLLQHVVRVSQTQDEALRDWFWIQPPDSP
ncbi:MAG: hypothetical protein VKJ46_02735 [Leptolyngbyaceae bacterium]|nr:hypothetical protein [Leptolyngbyaceae bacterium]